MSMNHQAFLFDASGFDAELRPLLEVALEGEDTACLLAFIERHRALLTDPCEGEPLQDDWPTPIAAHDVHQYGDLCLTKYYDPLNDIGLGDEWEAVQDLLDDAEPGAGKLVLGTPVNAGGVVFDPGKMGSYVVSPSEVKNNLATIDRLLASGVGQDDGVANLRSIYARAAEADKGLYVTF